MCFTSIKEKDFDYNKITTKIGIKPTKARNSKDFPLPSIKSGIAKTEWTYIIKIQDCDDIAIPFDEILRIFGGKEDDINNICSELDLEVTAVVSIHCKLGNTAMNYISQNAIHFLSRINANAGFDLYCYDDNNELWLEGI